MLCGSDVPSVLTVYLIFLVIPKINQNYLVVIKNMCPFLFCNKKILNCPSRRSDWKTYCGIEFSTEQPPQLIDYEH